MLWKEIWQRYNTGFWLSRPRHSSFKWSPLSITDYRWTNRKFTGVLHKKSIQVWVGCRISSRWSDYSKQKKRWACVQEPVKYGLFFGSGSGFEIFQQDCQFRLRFRTIHFRKYTQQGFWIFLGEKKCLWFTGTNLLVWPTTGEQRPSLLFE